MSTPPPFNPLRKVIPGPVPKPEEHGGVGGTTSFVTDGPIDAHRVHNAVDAADAPTPLDAPLPVADLPPPALAPSPYGAALPMPAEPVALPAEPVMPDMMSTGMLGMEAPAPPAPSPDGGPPPANPIEDSLMRGLLDGANLKRPPLGGGR